MSSPRANLYAMARQLGRPCAMGTLPIASAIAAITVTAHQMDKSGALGLGPEGTVSDAIRVAKHFFRQAYLEAGIKRGQARYLIAKQGRRMIEGNAPPNAIFAEAHNINGAAGFPLTEEEVKQEIVAEAAQIVRNRRFESTNRGR